MYDLKGFGERIETFRKKKGMTQDDLAQRLGVTSQAVSKWENDAAFPDITSIPAICAILEISLDDIFGRIKKDVGNIEFPHRYKGAEFICSFANIGCYSDKEVDKCDGSTVTFKDGSIAELSNRRIVNKGAGKILLKTADESFMSEDMRSGMFNLKKLTQTNLNFEYGKVRNLNCSIPHGNCTIERAEGDITTVQAEGYPEFIDLLEFDYSDTDKVLKLQYDRNKRNNLNNEMNKWDISKNNIKIKLAMDSEQLEDLGLSVDGAGDIKLSVPSKEAKMSINGSGGINASVSFENAGMAINGSGNIEFINADMLSASINGSGNIDFHDTNICTLGINGSGDINFDNAMSCKAGINGSGDIEADYADSLDASINGSGDMKFHRCGNLKAGIHGSGDFSVDKLEKSLDVSIHGSGDINIREGEVSTFNVYLQNGSVNAKGVTTDRAKIEIQNHGKVEIGRVKIESIEKCGDNAEVIIHNRG